MHAETETFDNYNFEWTVLDELLNVRLSYNARRAPIDMWEKYLERVLFCENLPWHVPEWLHNIGMALKVLYSH